MRDGLGMKSTGATFRKYSSAGVDWASTFLGIGLGLTLAPDGAIATSGTYERGTHIVDPHSGLIAIGAKSATVIGPDGGLADAMATALMVSGDDGATWFGREELHGYSAWVIERNDGGAWGVGPLITAR